MPWFDGHVGSRVVPMTSNNIYLGPKGTRVKVMQAVKLSDNGFIAWTNLLAQH